MYSIAANERAHNLKKMETGVGDPGVTVTVQYSTLRGGECEGTVLRGERDREVGSWGSIVETRKKSSLEYPYSNDTHTW